MKKPWIGVGISVILIIVWIVLSVFSASPLERAKARGCGANMTAICLCGRLWANDRDGNMPTNFICMSNELVTPKVLICPSDRDHGLAATWERFTPANCSYAMVTPGAREGSRNTVFIVCNTHGHRGY